MSKSEHLGPSAPSKSCAEFESLLASYHHHPAASRHGVIPASVVPSLPFQLVHPPLACAGAYQCVSRLVPRARTSMTREPMRRFDALDVFSSRIPHLLPQCSDSSRSRCRLGAWLSQWLLPGAASADADLQDLVSQQNSCQVESWWSESATRLVC
jgi:hypothetical protein